MESEQRQQVRKYLDILVRRKALILTCLLVGIAAGLVVYLTTPKLYQSEALLSYQKQSVNPSKMAPDSEGNIKAIVSTLSQIVTSRTSLETIIDEVGLYQEQRRVLPMEDVIEQMRSKIEITPSREGDIFQIAFRGSDPRQVARVTNAIASRVIEENLIYREARASETSAYTESELELAKEILDRKEAVMRDYKLKYYNEMSDQRAGNVSRLIALQGQYQARQDSIQDLERTRVLVQDQLAARRQILAENEKLRSVALANAAGQNVEDGAMQLSRLYGVLEALQTKYTDRHPDIIHLKRTIARLEASGAGGGSSSVNSEEARSQHDKVLADLQLQLKNIELSIENLGKEKEQLKGLIEQYEQWVAAAPVREAEWSALTREYGELKRHYDFLVSQNLQARSALNLERKQKGSQFRIEDPARVSETPIEPNFFKIMLISLVIGSGIGGALALGLNLLGTSFRDPEELERAFNLEVICTVPYVALEREVRKERMMTIAGSLLFLLSLSGIGIVFVYFLNQGRIIF